MGLQEDVQRKMAETRPPKRCAFGKILDSLDEGVRQDIEYSVERIVQEATLPQNERLFTVAWLHGVLSDNGYKIGRTAVGEHIRGGCICE